MSRSDGQMVSPLEASLDSVWRQLQEGLRGRMGTRGPRLRILWSGIGVSLEGPKFVVLGHPRSSWRKDLRPLEHDSCGESESNCGPYLGSKACGLGLSACTHDGWCASRELPSVSPGLSSAPQSSWQPYPDTSAPKRKATEPPEDTPVVVESLDTPAPLTPCVHESTHPVQFGIMPKRLPLPHLDDEILSGYEEDLSSIQDGYTALGNGRSGNATWSVSQSILIPMTGGTVHLIQSIVLTTTCPTVYLSRHASAF